MGRVNVVLSDGRVVSVDEDTARKIEAGPNATAHREAPAGEAARTDEETRHRRYGGVGGALASAATGGLDTLTLGGFGKVAGTLGLGDQLRGNVQENPGAYAVGAAGSLLVPGLGEVGGASQAARGARALGAGAGAARVVEGAALGIGGTIASGTVTGDPLTAEALLEGAGVGGLFNYGAGVLADRLTGVSQRAGKVVSVAEKGEAAEALFSSESPAYSELRDARTAAREDALASNRELKSQVDKYEAFTSSTNKFENAHRGMVKSISQAWDKYGPGTAEAAVAETTPVAGRFDVGDIETPEPRGDLDALNKAVDQLGGQRGTPLPTPGAARVGEPPVVTDIPADVTGTPPRTPAGETARTSSLRNELRGHLDRLDAALPLHRADPEAALGHFRDVRADLARKYDVAVPDLPEIPTGRPAAVPDALPATLKELAALRPDTAARIANAIGTDSEKAALAKLTEELGLKPGDTPSGTFADVHRVLSDHASALAEMKSLGVPKNAPLIGILKTAAKKVGAGLLTELALPGSGIAGGLLGAALVNKLVPAASAEARAALRLKVAKLVASGAGKAGRGARALGPVTAYLSRAFPSGRKDDQGGLSERAARRTAELTSSAGVAPDAVYAAVSPLGATAGDLALIVHQKAVGAIRDVAGKTPRDPGLTPRGGKSDWAPPPTDAVALAYRLEALHDPMTAVARALSGDVHPAAVDTLRTSWPALMGVVAEELSGRDLGTNSGGPSALLGGPQFGLDDPLSTVSLQGMYMPKQGAGAPQSPTPSALGRPPKVGPSKVAGANVDQLTSQ